MSSSSLVNKSFEMSELLLRQLESYGNEVMLNALKSVCARHPELKLDEELSALGNISVLKKEMKKREKKEKVSKSKSYPLPFIVEKVNMEGCHGLSYNHGLFTQCRNKCDNSHYCSKCADEADKNAKSVPDNGCIEDRLKVGLYEFKDPKGRSPIPYLKVLKNMKLDVSEVLKSVCELPSEHLEEKEVKKERKGRPKKEKSSNVNDMFADLEKEMGEESSNASSKKEKKSKKSEEEREAEREAKRKSKLEEAEKKRKEKFEAKELERKAKIEAKELEKKKKQEEKKLKKDKVTEVEKEVEKEVEVEKSSSKKESVREFKGINDYDKKYMRSTKGEDKDVVYIRIPKPYENLVRVGIWEDKDIVFDAKKKDVEDDEESLNSELSEESYESEESYD